MIFQDWNRKHYKILIDQSQQLKLEIWFKNFQQSTGVDGLTGEFYQTFRDELTSILLKLFQKVAEEGTLPNSLYKSIITLISKPGKDSKKKRNLQTNITDNHRYKNLQQILAKEIQQCNKRILNTWGKWTLSQGCKDFSTSINQCDTLY